jgi:hypothetical protein
LISAVSRAQARTGNLEAVPGRLSRIAAAAGAAARAVVEQRRESAGQRGLDGPLIGRREGPTVLPSSEVISQIVSDYGLLSTIDDDGDLTIRWETFSVYFFHYGNDEEVLQARLYLNRRFDVELRPTLALVLDDWNRSKLFPKAYTVLPDDGLVGICAEQAFDFEGGTSREQLKFTVGMWLQNLQQFADWIEEHV